MKTALRARCRRSIRERRSQKRFLCSDLIRIRWTSESGDRRDEVAILEDYSISGASLFLGVPIAAGTPLMLHIEDTELPASICYCVQAPNGYLAGINFMEPFSAAAGSRTYLPQHLLDISRLDFTQE